ncbi:MAG: long-chain fatty acid--CoA ligase [bacterium]|nr:long-chain fatty acid--CoA ligase [bacterium]
MFKKDWIAKWAEYTPDKKAIEVYEPNESLTYAQLNSKANHLSAHFESQGYEFGDRIMVLAEHSLEYVVLFSVAQKTGITLVPINYRLTSSEIDYLLSNCMPKVLIAERKFEDKVVGLKEDIKVIWMDEITQLIEHPKSTFESHEIPDDHPLFILYTSGTTGFPKGAIYSHKMLFWNSINTSQSLEITPSDHTITCMPTFHTGGWNVLLTPLLHRGATVGLIQKFDAGTILKLLSRESSNLFMGVPTMLKMMLETPEFESVDLSAMRYFIVGGEALPLAVIKAWHEKGVKIRQGYGLTEVGPNITSLHQDDAERKIGSIGKPNFYVEYKVVDDHGNEIKSGIGELCLKGPMTTPGYWQNQVATDKALIDGWFHTGDLVRVDEDGYLYVVDRKKSMFISGGENVYPAEVERVIRQIEDVDEAAIIGVLDEKWGEVGKAFITIKNGANFSESLVVDHCIDHLAKFKVPKYFVHLETMPKNDSGKINRKLLEQM